MTYEEEVKKLEVLLGWTLEEAADCGCNCREYPCDRCWNLGWAMGGIGEREKLKEQSQ